MSYGVFQEFYSSNWTLKGSRDITGIVGTTQNGVMYLSMPFLFALFSRRWAHLRQAAALCGVALTCLSFLLSSFSTDVWHLVATQGVLAALGCALICKLPSSTAVLVLTRLDSPTTLSLGEWFNTSNRAIAYGVTLSCKNIVGSACPFLLRVLLDRHGFRVTLRIWTAIAAATGALAIFLIPTHPSSLSSNPHRRRRIPWQFLKHQTFYIYSTAIVFQSCGYGIPQTYLNTYAHDITLLSQTSATLLLTLFNLPGILSSSFFGYLSDNKHLPLSATTVTSISAICSALSTFLLWGLTSQGSMALMVLFSITFGFFAGGYSATWGGVINEMELEAAQRNEAIDSGMIYGLLNGARGIGYVSGGLAGVPLLKAGSVGSSSAFAYGTTYGSLVIFTGLSSIFGALGMLRKYKRLIHVGS
jgi:predicted MFS family arabinose efflux permease